MDLLYLSIIQLSGYKIFLGHSKINVLLLSSWLIFDLRGNMTILNLFNTIKMLKLSYVLLSSVINKGFPFWFVNFDLTKETIIKHNSNKSGEFFVTRRWIRGLISNFFIITKAYRQYLLKKDFVDSNKVRDVFDKWFFTRFSWPRAIFISNVKSSFIVSKETASARVPSIALVDTDVKTFLYNIPIGCNDDSIEAIGFMNSLMSQYILRLKYKKVLIWYYFNRNVKRFNSLLDWLKQLSKLKKNIKYKIKIKDINIPDFADHYLDARNSINFFFGRSYNYKLLKKKYLIINYKSYPDSFYNLYKYSFFNRFKILNYKNLSYKYRLKFKRYNYLNKIEGVSLFKSFLNNFIKFNGLFNRNKRIKNKKRMRLARKKVSTVFKPFFRFIFFYYLNKFNFIMESYSKDNFNILNIIRLYERIKGRKERYKMNEKNMERYKYSYVFRYKSKRKKKRWYKRKHGYTNNKLNNLLNVRIVNMSFLFFYWKYFVMFLGLKLRNKRSVVFKKKFI